MRRVYLIFALVAVSAGQKLHKPKHGKGAYIASSPGSGENYSGLSQYDSPSPYSVHQQPKSHHHGGPSSAPAAKQTYPLLLADQRTLNQDGTINFNFQADNGLQQGETVDADGTRRGFYSYPGADGKLITVKYTAGKHGFIAEGDHLPLQPQAAAHSDKDEEEYVEPKSQRHHRPEGHNSYNPPSRPSYHHGDNGGHHTPSYNRPSPQYNHAPSAPRPPYKPAPAPSPYDGPSSFSSPFSGGRDEPSGFFGGNDGPQGFASPQTSFNNYAGGPSKAPTSGKYSGAGRFPSGPAAPSYASFGGPGGGPAYASASTPGAGYTANSPYQPGGAGPYKGKFDLGNSGHFAINFTPGSAQEYQPGPGGEGPSSINYSPSSVSYAGMRPAAPGPRQQGPYIGRPVPGRTRGQY